MKIENKTAFIVVMVLGLIFLSSCATPQPIPQQRPLYQLQDPLIGPEGSTHDHTALLIFLNGNVLDLSKPEYMIRSRPVHVENRDGSIIHKHAVGITIGHFLETLDFNFDKTCLVDDRETSYCTDDVNTLKFYVNGKQNDEFNNYVIKELDRVLISYGTEDESIIDGQLSILNNLKILS